MNAVQGARIAGARVIVALDPVDYKRGRSPEFGATHTAATVDEARSLVTDLTRGQMADVCVVSTDSAEGAHVAQALSLVGKRPGGDDAIPRPADTSVDMSLFDLTLYEKQLRGSLFGSSNPGSDIPRILDLHRAGRLKLDELVTRECTLEDINTGYADTHAGVNLCGLIRL